MSRLSNSTTRALREPLPVLTLALTRHVGCTAGIYRRLWPLQMTPVRTTNGAMPTSSRARQRRRGSSAKPGAIADIDPRPRLPAETRSDGARSEVRAGDGMRGSNACVDRTLARQRVVSTLCTQGLSTAAHSSCAKRSSSGWYLIYISPTAVVRLGTGAPKQSELKQAPDWSS